VNDTSNLEIARCFQECSIHVLGREEESRDHPENSYESSKDHSSLVPTIITVDSYISSFTQIQRLSFNDLHLSSYMGNTV